MFNNSTILITGGTGSWGQELVKQLLEKYSPKEIRIYSRGENKQVLMQRQHENNKILKFIIGDVRDKYRLDHALKNVDYVVHLAALKHVHVCEEHPIEAVHTNVLGTQNLIEACINNNIKKVILVSSDKACEPFNLYGVTKSCAEKLILAAKNENHNTSFSCIRGGNVIGSSESVIPLFRRQILENNEITITDTRMTRFIFTLSDAVSLIFKAFEKSKGGELFVMKMPGMKLTDLAQAMIEEIGNKNTKTKIIGIRPGEKINEVLLSKHEKENIIDDEHYFIILPKNKTKEIEEYYKNYKKTSLPDEFSSLNTRMLNKEELKILLRKGGWLDKPTGEDTVKHLGPQEFRAPL